MLLRLASSFLEIKGLKVCSFKYLNICFFTQSYRKYVYAQLAFNVFVFFCPWPVYFFSIIVLNNKSKTKRVRPLSVVRDDNP